MDCPFSSIKRPVFPSSIPSAAQLPASRTLALPQAAASLTTMPFVSKDEGNKNRSDRVKYPLIISRFRIEPVNTHFPYMPSSLAYSSILQLLSSSERPDAFFTCSDVFAAAAISAAHSFGIKVPDELSVIGFDNVETSRITSPTITTISQPAFHMGQHACAMLIEKILSGRNMPNRHLLLDTEFIIRESTKTFM